MRLLFPTPRTFLRSLPLLSLLGLLVGGCTVGPNYHRPDYQPPTGWAGPTVPGGEAATQPTTRPTTGPVAGPTTRPVDLATWWDSFADPTLSALVRDALESNLDLQIATSRVLQARASRRAVSSALYPNVNTSGGYTRSGTGRSSDGPHDFYRAGIDASWELDVFGGVRRSVEAANAEVDVAVEDRRDVLVILAADVALNYVDLRNFQRQIDIARSNVVLQRRSADLTRRQFNAGFVSALDVANADTLVASTESQIPLLESSERQTLYALSVLLGREPAALLQDLSVTRPIPGQPPEVPVGLPSELLARRPDIRRADAQLHAATARVGVATADLYPRFLLNGSFNVSANKIARMGDWSSTSWSIGPSISWPLFDAGRIRANIAFQNESARQAALSYRATILTALREVEDALINYAKLQEHRRSLAAALAANRRAVDLATTLYSQGQTDFLNVLSAQRSLYAAEDAIVQSDRNLAAALISLYRALGGGW